MGIGAKGLPMSGAEENQISYLLCSTQKTWALLENHIHRMDRKCSQMEFWQWKSVSVDGWGGGAGEML